MTRTPFATYMQILGFELDDQSDDAEIARTWLNATLDEYEGSFEDSTPHQIRSAFQEWLKEARHDGRL